MEPSSNKPSPFSSQPKTPPKAPEAPPKEESKKPGLLGEKGLKRSCFREELRKYHGKITGTERYLSKKQRVALEKNFSYKKYGPTISPKDAKKRIKELQKERVWAKQKRKDEIDDEVGLIRKF